VSIGGIEVSSSPVIIAEHLVHGDPPITGKIQLLVAGKQDRRRNKC